MNRTERKSWTERKRHDSRHIPRMLNLIRHPKVSPLKHTHPYTHTVIHAVHASCKPIDHIGHADSTWICYPPFPFNPRNGRDIYDLISTQRLEREARGALHFAELVCGLCASLCGRTCSVMFFEKVIDSIVVAMIARPPSDYTEIKEICTINAVSGYYCSDGLSRHPSKLMRFPRGTSFLAPEEEDVSPYFSPPYRLMDFHM